MYAYHFCQLAFQFETPESSSFCVSGRYVVKDMLHYYPTQLKKSLEIDYV